MFCNRLSQTQPGRRPEAPDALGSPSPSEARGGSGPIWTRPRGAAPCQPQLACGVGHGMGGCSCTRACGTCCARCRLLFRNGPPDLAKEDPQKRWRECAETHVSRFDATSRSSAARQKQVAHGPSICTNRHSKPGLPFPTIAIKYRPLSPSKNPPTRFT